MKHVPQIPLALLTCPNQCARMTTTKISAITIASLTVAFACFAETNTTNTKGSSAPYNEGPVWTLTMIKTKTGLGDEYLKQITQTVKPVYEEEKKQKIILDYKILNGEAIQSSGFQYPDPG